jgi:hypothetical protein
MKMKLIDNQGNVLVSFSTQQNGKLKFTVESGVEINSERLQEKIDGYYGNEPDEGYLKSIVLDTGKTLSETLKETVVKDVKKRGRYPSDKS